MRSLHLNKTTVVGVVRHAPRMDREGRVCHFVIETQSLDYTRADDTRHMSRVEEIPVRCHGKMTRWAIDNLREDEEVIVVGAIQTHRVKDAYGHTYRAFYILSQYIRKLQSFNLSEKNGNSEN